MLAQSLPGVSPRRDTPSWASMCRPKKSSRSPSACRPSSSRGWAIYSPTRRKMACSPPRKITRKPSPRPACRSSASARRRPRAASSTCNTSGRSSGRSPMRCVPPASRTTSSCAARCSPAAPRKSPTSCSPTCSGQASCACFFIRNFCAKARRWPTSTIRRWPSSARTTARRSRASCRRFSAGTPRR